VSHYVIDLATVKPAAWFACVVYGQSTIVPDGSHLRSPEATLNVLFGCEGLDLLMLLSAAIVCAPANWSFKLSGWFVACLFVWSCNQMRILSLYAALRAYPKWFGPLHGFLAPLGLVVLVALYFLIWLRLSQSAAGPRVPFTSSHAA